MTTGEAASATATMLTKMNRDERKLIGDMLLDQSIPDQRLHSAIKNIAIESVRRLSKKENSGASWMNDFFDSLKPKSA